jgi:hypothetical protein
MTRVRPYKGYEFLGGTPQNCRDCNAQTPFGLGGNGVCSRCHGTGKDFWGDPCRSCHGSKKCNTCEGSGRVYVED